MDSAIPLALLTGANPAGATGWGNSVHPAALGSIRRRRSGGVSPVPALWAAASARTRPLLGFFAPNCPRSIEEAPC